MNVMLLGSLLYGLSYHVQGFINVGLFLTWCVIITSFVMDSYFDIMKNEKRTVPPAVDMMVDIAVIGILVWYSYIFTASLYLISIVNQQGFINKIIKYQKDLENALQNEKL